MIMIKLIIVMMIKYHDYGDDHDDDHDDDYDVDFMEYKSEHYNLIRMMTMMMMLV